MKMSSEKKKIFGVILSFLLVFSMSVPVMAEDENYPRYLDDAGLLSSSQAQKLEKKLDKISKEHHCDVVIAVANTTNGQDIESFTEDFYDSMGYGQCEKKSGIMLMVSMKERQWNMCTTGDAIDAFTDAGLDYIGETFITYLSDEKYNKAFTTFARLSDKFLNQAEKGKPYDSGHMPKGSVSPFWIFGDLAIGILIALIWGNVKKAKLKSVKKQVAAQEYTKPGSLRLTMNSDRFVNRTVTTRVIQNNNSNSSGGGSSVHNGSSGTSHGGKSGSF